MAGNSGLAQILLFSALLTPATAQRLTSTLVAGPGDPGDGQAAPRAFVPSPEGIAVDASGNVYIAEVATSRIRRVSPQGVITTFAGTGAAGFSGDGGPASQAQLDGPRGLALGPDGSLYVADSGNNRIRRISSAGTIETVAGTGDAGFSGDGGPALEAMLNYPYDVQAGRDGSLYIADYGNNRVRRISAGIIQTIAGDGDWGDPSSDGPAVALPLEGPKTVGVSPSGEVYLSDWSYRIRKITLNGTLTTVAGTGTYGFSGDGGPATAAAIAGTEAITVDQSGDLYISDRWNARLRLVTPDGVITTVAGNGRYGFSGDGALAVDAQIAYPTMLATDSAGNVYFSDFGNARVRQFLPGSTINTFAGSDDPRDGGKATDGRLLYPTAIAVDANGLAQCARMGSSRRVPARARLDFREMAGLLSMPCSGVQTESRLTCSEMCTSPTRMA